MDSFIGKEHLSQAANQKQLAFPTQGDSDRTMQRMPFMRTGLFVSPQEVFFTGILQHIRFKKQPKRYRTLVNRLHLRRL